MVAPLFFFFFSPGTEGPPPVVTPSAVTVLARGSASPLAMMTVKPFVREGCGVRGVRVDNTGTAGKPIVSTGYRLGASHLLTLQNPIVITGVVLGFDWINAYNWSGNDNLVLSLSVIPENMQQLLAIGCTLTLVVSWSSFVTDEDSTTVNINGTYNITSFVGGALLETSNSSTNGYSSENGRGAYTLTATPPATFRAAARDENGMWSEWSAAISATPGDFSAGTTEASIGSAAQTDIDISSPAIVFPDMAHGSSKMTVRRTLVTNGFMDETQTAQWPRQQAAFTVKLDILTADEAALLHRFFRALNGPTTPFFFDYVDPADGFRTTAVSRRYLVRFRDGKLADSLFAVKYSEMQFVLSEVVDCSPGGDTYEYRPPSSLNLDAAVAPAHYIDTEFQFEPRGALSATSPRWKSADSDEGGIVVSGTAST